MVDPHHFGTDPETSPSTRNNKRLNVVWYE